MKNKKRMTRETLLKQVGDISETYVLEAADIASSERPERQERRGGFWFRLRTSPIPAVCLGFVVALVVIAAIVRAGWTSPETPVGTEGGLPGASLPGTDANDTSPVDAPEEDAELIAQGYTAQIGRIVRYTGGYFFVWQDSYGRWDFTVLTKGFGQTDAIPDDLNNGDLVRVYYQYIQETYPSSMPVYRAELLQRGQLDLVDGATLGNIMALSGDMEMGTGWAICFDNIQTGRLYHDEANDLWYLFWTDDEGHTTGRFDLLYDYLVGDADLANFQTGDLVTVSGDSYLESEPPILPAFYITLRARGTEADIDPEHLARLKNDLTE